MEQNLCLQFTGDFLTLEVSQTTILVAPEITSLVRLKGMMVNSKQDDWGDISEILTLVSILKVDFWAISMYLLWK